MKKLSFFLMALLVSLTSFAKVMNEVTVPTNAELWEVFKPYYNTYYGLTRADQPIDKVSTFASAKMQEIMTDAASEYKWLGDYVLGVAAAQGLNLSTDMASANESGWRWAVHAFFNATTGANGAAGTDFTEAGKPENWGPAYLAAQKPAEPATETVYFINAKKWAKVNVYAWTTDPNASWPGAAATKEAEQIAGYDVYSFTANAGQYANVIFNDGSSQTPDLVWTAGKYYVIDMGWLTKEEAETKLAAPLPETWNIVGAAGLMGTDWNLNDAKNAMTLQADGTYLLEKKGITLTAGTYEYKAAKDHGWTVAIPQDGNQKLTISTSGIYDVTFVLNVTAKKLTATATLKQAAVVIPTIVIAGDMNSWNQTKDKFTMSADSLTATFKTTLAVKNYGFKMIVGGSWHSDGKTITRAANSTKFTGANSNTNSTLKADIAGEYLFTWEYATKTLTVTYPALPVKYNVTVTAENGTVTGAGEYEEGATATLTATAAEGYEFVNWTVGEEVVSTENPYSFVVTADVALVANFELIPPTKYNVTVTAENGTVTGAGEYEEGATATLTATAAEGYEFVNWTVGEEVVSTENPYSFVVTADVALVANFKKVEDPVVELPAATVRAWAYDLALAVEGEQYTFSYKATTAAKATLIFSDAEGVELATKDLGLVEAGANTAVLAAAELPAGKKVNWAIKLEAGAIAEFTELTDASKGIYNFYLPQGVAVDNNPESATFGTIYVAAATDGASDGGSVRADTQKRGIFIYDQELNELNPTSNVGIVPSNVTFGATSRQVMKRLVINPATNEVAFAHNAAPMAVWAVPTENVGGEAKNLIEGLGFTNVNSICFTEDGTLYVLESNGYPAPGSLYKVVNGVVDTIFANNTRFGNADNALVSDNRGGVWICQNRSQLDTYNQLTHVNAAGEIDFEVNTATPHGFESKNTARGTIAYNPAEDILAMSIGTGSTIGASLFKVTYDETTGVPALTLIGSTPSMGKNVDGLAFDYAGDLYGLSANAERLYKYAVPTDNNVCTTPAAAKYAFEVKVEIEIVGTVKRAVQNGEEVIVLTHEADGTAHIYQVVDGKAVAEVSLEGVVPVNPDNLGDYLAISDIAVTEDGKLVARNYMRVTNLNYTPDAGYERGENRFYIWNDLAGAPSVWFTSLMTSNSIRSDQGITMAVKGTSTNAKVLTTGVHNSGRGIRMSLFTIKDGKYVDPNGGAGNKSEYYWYLDSHFKSDAVYNEAAYGVLPELSASPLGENNWIMDNVGMAPSEFSEPADGGGDPIVNTVLADDVVGKKFNGATYVTVNDQVLMVAPYATAEGLLAGVKVLDITAGLASATEVAVANLDAAIEATAAATAVEVVEGGLNITLVADAAIHTLTAKVGNDTPDQGLTLTATGLETQLESDGSYTLQGLAVVNGDESNLMDFMLCVYPTDGYTDAFLNGWSVMIFGAPTPGAFVENEDGTFTYTAQIEDTYGDGTVYNINMSGTIKKTEGPEYMELDDQITNMTIDLENMVIYGGPSTNFEIEVVLGLGEDNFDGSFTLSDESSVVIKGIDAEFVEGYVYNIDINAPSAVAVVKVNWDGMYYAFTLTMSAAPAEATVVVVENATVEIEKYLLFGDTYDYALKMTGEWINPEDGLTYPVLVEVPVYYPESTEPFEMLSTVTVGGWGDNDPWLGFGEGTLTVTTVGNTITATGRVENPMAGVVIDITISGTITPSSVENATVTVKSVKMIKNGQLVIEKDGVQYNAQGTTLK